MMTCTLAQDTIAAEQGARGEPAAPMGVVLEEDARRGRVVGGGFLGGSGAEKRAKVANEVPPAWPFFVVSENLHRTAILVLSLRSSWLFITD